MSSLSRILTATAAGLVCPALFASDADLNSLKPLMNVPGPIAYENDFESPGAVNKSDWQRRQGTRWALVNGVFYKKSRQEQS